MKDNDTRADGWYNDAYYGDVMVTYGQGFVVRKDLQTVCIGDYPPGAVPQPARHASPAAEIKVLQHDTKGIIPDQPIQAEVLQQKNKGGRPRGGTSRWTRYRRAKEQLEMAI